MWNAFPGNQLRRWGRSAIALIAADQLLSLAQYWDRPAQFWRGGQGSALFYRPQDEYCEWRVERNDEGQIGRVVFTSEPPEYFQAVCGDELVWDDESDSGKVHFTGDRKLLVELYQKYVNPAVKLDDLLCPADLWQRGRPAPAPGGPKPRPDYRKGEYNPVQPLEHHPRA